MLLVTMERVRRIELLSLAWKAKVLPLHNTRFGSETGIRTQGTLARSSD